MSRRLFTQNATQSVTTTTITSLIANDLSSPSTVISAAPSTVTTAVAEQTVINSQIAQLYVAHNLLSMNYVPPGSALEITNTQLLARENIGMYFRHWDRNSSSSKYGFMGYINTQNYNEFMFFTDSNYTSPSQILTSDYFITELNEKVLRDYLGSIRVNKLIATELQLSFQESDLSHTIYFKTPEVVNGVQGDYVIIGANDDDNNNSRFNIRTGDFYAGNNIYASSISVSGGSGGTITVDELTVTTSATLNGSVNATDISAGVLNVTGNTTLVDVSANDVDLASITVSGQGYFNTIVSVSDVSLNAILYAQDISCNDISYSKLEGEIMNAATANVTDTAFIESLGVNRNATVNGVLYSPEIDISGVTLSKGIGDDFYVTNGSNSVYLASAGAGWVTVSDARYKENAVEMEGVLEKMEGITGYEYNYVGGTRRHYGLMAQEVMHEFPHAIEESEGKMGINYSEMIAPLIQCIHELKDEIKGLKKRVRELELTHTTGGSTGK